MRVLITGGGTGGHVYPALAIADTVKRNVPNSVIEYVGTSRGIENKLVPKAGYKLHHIEIRGIKRSLSLSNLKTAYYVLTAPAKAKKLIKEFKPDIVIGTGGYVCWPVVKAACDMGIPTALHESNVAPGVAVKALASKVDRIYLNFKATADSLENVSEKLLFCGNPVRKEKRATTPEEAKKELGIGKSKYLLLSYGGSLGAQKVNEAILDVMKKFTSQHPEVYHIHASGSSGYENFKKAFCEAGLDGCENIRLCEYIYDMPLCLAGADLVVCRAGAMTVSELASSGKSAIFIPSPNVTNNHQFKNAKVLAEDGAALVYEENSLEEGFLAEKIGYLFSDVGCGERLSMGEKIKSFAVNDADKIIFEDILKLTAKKN